jgi:hypothetical protein
VLISIQTQVYITPPYGPESIEYTRQRVVKSV